MPLKDPKQRKEYDANRDKTKIICHICGGSSNKKGQSRHLRTNKHIVAYDSWMRGLYSVVDDEPPC